MISSGVAPGGGGGLMGHTPYVIYVNVGRDVPTKWVLFSESFCNGGMFYHKKSGTGLIQIYLSRNGFRPVWKRAGLA